jgi:hypothetical protein
MTRLAFHLLDLFAIILFLGGGAFFLQDAGSRASELAEVLLGSVLVSVGLIVAFLEARFFSRALRQAMTDPTRD